jgi:hypothetical protein
MRALLVLGGIFLGCGNSSHPLTQHEVTSPGDLLTSDGQLREPGWSRQALQTWDPSRVHDPSRFRGWDFFTVMSSEAAINLTIADLGFVKVASVGSIDLQTSAARNASVFASGTDFFALSNSIDDASELLLDGKMAALTFAGQSEMKVVSIGIPMSLLGQAASGSLTITRPPSLQYLSLATPFDGDPHEFFYEQKIEGLTADGSVTIGDRTFTFTGANAVEDWGRGEWPSQVTWRWAGGSDGKTVAFNLGEGFGDDSHGTENLVVYMGTAYKLGRVSWSHGDPVQDWKFTSDKLSLTLHPTAEESGGLDFGTRYSKLKKGYGSFSGTITLDDGRIINIDALPGFAEEENLAW